MEISKVCHILRQKQDINKMSLRCFLKYFSEFIMGLRLIALQFTIEAQVNKLTLTVM